MALKGIQGLELALMMLITAASCGYVIASVLNLFYTDEELKEFEDE